MQDVHHGTRAVTATIRSIVIALAIPLSVGLLSLSVCIYTLTFTQITQARARWLVVVRLALSIPALITFWDFGFGHLTKANDISQTGISRQIYCALATISLYGIMRVLDTNVASIWDKEPPHWITVKGEHLPLPSTTFGRIAYAFDLLTSLRGSSWFSDRHWNFASPSIAGYRNSMTRRTFVFRGMRSLALKYILVDLIDTAIQSQNFDPKITGPVTSRTPSVQLVYTVCLCMWTYLGMSTNYTVTSISCVGLGLSKDPSSWPPLFDSPFSSPSLSEFWARRWHQIFRRTFSRMCTIAGRLLFVDPVAQFSARARRNACIAFTFVLSTLLHLIIMHRVVPDDRHPHSAFWDLRILHFFLAQPVGILIDQILASLLYSRFPMTRRIFAWGWLIWTARWWSDVWVQKGLWDANMRPIPSNWSPMQALLSSNFMIQ